MFLLQTFNGKVLISINPFDNIDIYSTELIASYKKNPFDQPAHIYSLGGICLKFLNQSKNPQSIIITGESGAGKTEATKILLKFLCSETRLAQIADSSNCLLNAFTCAETRANLTS